jgi:hypothetical protein
VILSLRHVIRRVAAILEAVVTEIVAAAAAEVCHTLASMC